MQYIITIPVLKTSHLDNVRVCQKEDDLCTFDATVPEHLGQVLPELGGAVATVEGELEQFTSRYVTGQLYNGRLPCPIHTNLWKFTKFKFGYSETCLLEHQTYHEFSL